MNVREFEEWLRIAKEQAAKSGQVIDDYEIAAESESGRVNLVSGAKVDHGSNTLWILS